ncbi:MAG: alpha/beta fold hydrolase [Candidatus Omnitrophota bacterium]|nr:alpha/beta fold hydrolase [Candidatus Omnitrophota bacterium]
MSEFKLFDRGAEKTVLLIPGWAADYRMFNSLDLDANYLMPVRFSPFDFEKSFIRAAAKYSIDRISVIGWSMGGFIGADLLSKYKDMITDITFISVRKRYPEEEIKSVRSYLKKNRTAFLYRFYNDCFSADEREELSAFKTGLMRGYLKEMSMDTLLEGLQYLSTSRIEPQSLAGVKAKFIHGEEDKIAPIKEVLELKDELPDMRLIAVKGAGHIPFLNKNFKEIF